MARDNVKLMFHVPPSGVSTLEPMLHASCMETAYVVKDRIEASFGWLWRAGSSLKCPKLQHFGKQCFNHGISAGKSQSQEEQETIGAMYPASSHKTFVSSKMDLSELHGIWMNLARFFSAGTSCWRCCPRFPCLWMSVLHLHVPVPCPFPGTFLHGSHRFREASFLEVRGVALKPKEWDVLWQWWYRGHWNWGEWNHRRLFHTDTIQIHVCCKKRMIWYDLIWCDIYGNVNLSAFEFLFNECLRSSLPRVSKMDWC